MQRRFAHIQSILLVFSACVLLNNESRAQYYSTGQEPASIRWKQIKTDHVKLIFPDYYEARARKLATYLDSTHAYSGISLEYSPKRIPVIVHTQSAKSNAVVAWAPKRMEIYTMPPQDMYAQPWLEQLSIHEYRHVVQIEKLNQGPTKVLSWFFGQQGTAAILGLYVPPWFLEGDAVVAETGLSYSGRGRDPRFEMRLRAQVLLRGSYSYDKATLGSYRDYIPSHYQLGYFLVAEGRRKYGSTIWSHAIDRVGRRPYMVTPFQNGIKEISSKRMIPFYEESMSSLGERWKRQDSLTGFTEVRIVSPAQKRYTDYRHPVYINESEVVALKTSIDDIPRFVKIDSNGKEKVVFTPGFIKTDAVSYADGKLCWAENRADLRWANRSYTVIRILDIKAGKARTLSNKLRLFAPSLNKDASRIVAVNSDSLDHYSLIVLDAETGNIDKKIPLPPDIFPLTPVWAGENLIITVLVSENGKTLAKIDPGSGQFKYFLNWDYSEIYQPYFSQPYIYFTGSWSGISDIYALSKETAEIHMVSTSRFGASDPYVSENGDELLYVDYTDMGYRIVSKPLDTKEWKPLTEIRDHSIKLYKSVAQEESILPPWSEVPASDAPAKKYSKPGNLFNFHSWAPLDINASTYEIHPGVSIMSQNLLSSSFLTAGYSYNLNEQAGKVYGTYSYEGWYPIVDLTADYGLRRDYATDGTEVKWHETNLRAGLRLPLNLNRGKHFAGISISAYANQILRRMTEGSTLSFRNPDIFSMWYSLTAYRQIKSNFRDIFPRWGQSIGIYYRNTPLEGEQNSISATILNLYFPGIIRHQGLNIYAGYQQREISEDNASRYKFSDLVAYPRGVANAQDESLLSIRSTYALPIAYPDWSIGPVVYMKRIRANLFFDYAIGWGNNNQYNYNSAGADLLTEVHLLRFIAPFEFGVRYAYRIDNGTNYWAFLFSIGFSSFGLGETPLR